MWQPGFYAGLPWFLLGMLLDELDTFRKDDLAVNSFSCDKTNLAVSRVKLIESLYGSALAVCDPVAVLVPLQLAHDLETLLLQRPHIFPDGAPFTGNAHFIETTNDLTGGDGVVFVGLLPQQLHELEQLDLLAVFFRHDIPRFPQKKARSASAASA